MTDIYNPLDKINLGNSVATALLEQPVHPLGDIPSFEGAGIYVLYYRGPFPAYAPIAAANAESSALARLMVVVENYPQLRSNETFSRLMDDLAGTENRLATERMRYNERLQEYNTLRRRFPSNVTAKIFGFGEYPYFDAPESAQAVPKVNFN